MVNSRAKGARGELEAAKAVASILSLPDCVRSAQACGAWAADLMNTKGLHIEVKRPKTLPVQIKKYIKQAQDDSANTGQLPLVLTREDQGAWLLILKLNDVPRLVRELQHLLIDPPE